MKRRASRLQSTSAANTRPAKAIGITTMAWKAPVMRSRSIGYRSQSSSVSRYTGSPVRSASQTGASMWSGKRRHAAMAVSSKPRSWRIWTSSPILKASAPAAA